MKIVLTLLLVFSLLFALISCDFGGNPAEPTGKGQETTTTEQITTTEEETTTVAVVSEEYRKQASLAYQDLIDNWWVGSRTNGHFLTGDGNGWFIWEAAMSVFAVESYYDMTEDDDALDYIKAEWKYLKATYSKSQFTTAGDGFNYAQDDAGWSAMLYMTFYHRTGDEYCLTLAHDLIKNSYAHWKDGSTENGLFYDHDLNDKNSSHKSLHMVSLLLAAMDYIEETENEDLLQDTLNIYEWIEENMLRDGEFTYLNNKKQTKTGNANDHLYFFNYNTNREGAQVYNGPEWGNTPFAIAEGGANCIFIGGVMGMAVMHMRLYNYFNEPQYLTRANETLRALNDKAELLGEKGGYKDIGDGWTNAAFLRQFITEVLGNNQISTKKKDVEILQKTADSIYTYAKTSDGHYSASWEGPAEDDSQTAWGKMGWTHNISMTCATSIHMVIGAGLCEALNIIGK